MPCPYKAWTQELGVTSILTLCVVGAVSINWFISQWKNRRINAFMASIPGPTPLPVVGTVYTMFAVTTDNLCNVFRSIVKKYPKIGAQWIFSEPMVITGDVEILNAVWANPQLIEKIPEYKRFELGYRGVFMENGEEWRTLRKILNPCFRTNILTSMDESISRYVRNFLDKIEKHADDGKEFDIVPSVQLFSLDVVLEFSAGMKDDSLTRNYGPDSFARDTRKLAELLFERVVSPMLWSDWFYALTGRKKEFDEVADRMREILTKVINEVIEAKKIEMETASTDSQQTEKFPTFLEVVLEHIGLGTIPEHYIIDEMIEICVAGSLTTTCIKSWVFQLLAMFPDIQEKAYQEIIELTGGKEVTTENLSKLTYLDMIVKETLRHFSVPAVGRQLVTDLKVNDKMIIPKGIRLITAMWALHHDPELWEKPGEFYPEHFSEANLKTRPKGAFVPFIAGSRDCIGAKYSMQTIKILVANTLLRYKFSTTRKPPKDFREGDFRWVLCLWPAEGYSVKICRRNTEQQ